MAIHIDIPSRSYLVLDGASKVIRIMAPPKQSEYASPLSDQSGLDANGNILYRGYAPTVTTDTFTTPDRATAGIASVGFSWFGCRQLLNAHL